MAASIIGVAQDLLAPPVQAVDKMGIVKALWVAAVSLGNGDVKRSLGCDIYHQPFFIKVLSSEEGA